MENLRQWLRLSGYQHLLEFITCRQAMEAAELGNRVFVTDEAVLQEVEEHKEALRRLIHAKELLEEIAAHDYTFTVANLKPEIATSPISTHEDRPNSRTHPGRRTA